MPLLLAILISGSLNICNLIQMGHYQTQLPYHEYKNGLSKFRCPFVVIINLG